MRFNVNDRYHAQASAPSRIINITTSDYRKTKFDKDDPNFQENYDATIAYKRSKLANVLFTRELSERLKGGFPTTIEMTIINTENIAF